MMEKQTAFYSVVVVFSKDKKKILLGKRREDKKWTSPAGGGHPGETPEDTAVRELFEEANIQCSKSDLKGLTSVMAGNGKPIFIYILQLKEKQDIHVKKDPDKEVPSWQWFGLDEMPSMDKNRQETVNMAKMKMMDLIKSIVSTDMQSGVDLNTQDFSQDDMASRDTVWHEKISNFVAEMEFNEPSEMFLENSYGMKIMKISEGLYSGSIYNTENGDKIINFNELSIPSLIQMLKAKEFIGRDEDMKKENEIVEKLDEISDKLDSPPEGDSDVKVEAPGLESLKELISQLRNIHVEGDLNITIKKSLHELINDLYKASEPKRSKRGFPVGTQRTWSNGVTAVKHADGWVVIGGKHHGKLMGKFKGEALYKTFVDTHMEVLNKGGVIETQRKRTTQEPKDSKDRKGKNQTKEEGRTESPERQREETKPESTVGGEIDGSSNGPVGDSMEENRQSQMEGNDKEIQKGGLTVSALISKLKGFDS